MNRRVPGVAWYRFRVTFGRRRGGYLSVVVLIGLIGGIAMASISRRPAHPIVLSDLLGQHQPIGHDGLRVHPEWRRCGRPHWRPRLAHLPDVKRVTDLVGPNFIPLAKNGAPRLNTSSDVSIGGSVDGMFLRQDRLTAIQGQLADPNRADEMVMTAPAARILDVHVGQVVPLGFYTDAQTNLAGLRHSERGAPPANSGPG